MVANPALLMLFLSSSAAPGGEHESRLGGVAACWTGGSRHPVPRRVPLIRQAEGAQQPQSNSAAGADVSEASASEDNTQHQHFFWLDDLIFARECNQIEGFCSSACCRISHTWRIPEMMLLQEMVCADCFFTLVVRQQVCRKRVTC